MTLFVALVFFFLCSLMEATLLSLTPGQVAEMGVRHLCRGAIPPPTGTPTRATPSARRGSGTG
jgi:hypothetical protein